MVDVRNFETSELMSVMKMTLGMACKCQIRVGSSVPST